MFYTRKNQHVLQAENVVRQRNLCEKSDAWKLKQNRFDFRFHVSSKHILRIRRKRQLAYIPGVYILQRTLLGYTAEHARALLVRYLTRSV